MVELANQEMDGFDVLALKVFLDPIVGSMLMNVHHNRAWAVQLALMVLADSLAFARKVDVVHAVKFVSLVNFISKVKHI